MSYTTTPVPLDLDCGHPATIVGHGIGTGYAVESDTGRKVCYHCAADVDREYAATMTPSSPALFAYLNNGQRIDSTERFDVVTWAGVKLGHAYAGPSQRDGFGNKVRYLDAFIDGRKFHGRTYPDSGNYTRLRPFKGQ